MNAEELRARQAPLKARYKSEPELAVVTLRAGANVLLTEQVAEVETHAGIVQAGLHPATGGDGSTACSADMLLQALAGCAGVTLAAVATALGVRLIRARVEAEGEVDFRGTLGVSRDAPVGFTDIRLRFDFETDAPPETTRELVELTERYCVVYQTLKRSPTLGVVSE